MKCENCGMGFIISPINVDKVCPHCGHIHGDDYVEHTHDDGVTHAHEGGDVPHTHEEDNMIKKIWKAICWPWKKLVDWLWTR
jgi:hypothetical protein